MYKLNIISVLSGSTLTYIQCHTCTSHTNKYTVMSPCTQNDAGNNVVRVVTLLVRPQIVRVNFMVLVLHVFHSLASVDEK
jgi:hypothetical protein